MQIRKAVPGDAERVYELLKTEKNKSFSVKNFREAAKHDDSIFFVAEDAGKITGYVIGFLCPTNKGDCMLAETRVMESERKKGIGSKLVGRFSAEAFERGAESIYAGVAEKDMTFYTKTNFKRSPNQWVEMIRKR